MKVGVLMINFGEPEEPTLEKVTPFLERIFLQNSGLDEVSRGKERARELARRRAPELVTEYEVIGGSPLNRQAGAQAGALRQEFLQRLGKDVAVYSAFQFTEPSLEQAVAAARQDGMGTLIGLPVYPLCGQSTSVAALDKVQTLLEQLDWQPRFAGIGGWHNHPAYVALRASAIGNFVRSEGLDLADPETLLYFSAHGTPLQYLDDGNRYDRYVEDHCSQLARVLGVDRWTVGFQNHGDRDIAWTWPANEHRINTIREQHIVVDAVSFMHEQSETLMELDRVLRSHAERIGKAFHRVPVPHDHPAFIPFLADLVQAVLAGAEGGIPGILTRCRCRVRGDTWCTNGARELPLSPYRRRSGPG
ncbi:MAG: ferrochelatase [Gemmatimonadales bacterium]